MMSKSCAPVKKKLELIYYIKPQEVFIKNDIPLKTLERFSKNSTEVNAYFFDNPNEKEIFEKSIETKAIFETPTWAELVEAGKAHTMHFIAFSTAKLYNDVAFAKF